MSIIINCDCIELVYCTLDIQFDITVSKVLFLVLYSILGRIIRVTDEVSQYRQWIAENFQMPLPSPPYEISSDADSNISEEYRHQQRHPPRHHHHHYQQNNKSYAKALAPQQQSIKRWVVQRCRKSACLMINICLV